MSRQIDELATLHDHYVSAVNAAVTRGDIRRAEALAGDYDAEAVDLADRADRAVNPAAERDGRSHQRLSRPTDRRHDGALRRLMRRHGGHAKHTA